MCSRRLVEDPKEDKESPVYVVKQEVSEREKNVLRRGGTLGSGGGIVSPTLSERNLPAVTWVMQKKKKIQILGDRESWPLPGNMRRGV